MSEAPVDLVLINPEVMAVRSSVQPVDDPPHVNWFVGYAPVREPEVGGRVVFGTLHAAGTVGAAEVHVAAMMRYDEANEPGTEAFANVLAQSDALETLYDVARMAFRSVAALTSLDIELPVSAPDPEITQLVRNDEESDASSDEEAATPEQ